MAPWGVSVYDISLWLFVAQVIKKTPFVLGSLLPTSVPSHCTMADFRASSKRVRDEAGNVRVVGESAGNEW